MTPYCAGAVSPDPAERITERQRETAGSPRCGCSRCSRPCLSNSIIVGFGIFFNPALGAWGLYRPVSKEKGQPFARLPLWVAILLYHLKTEIEALDIFLCFAMIILQYVGMEELLYNIHHKEKLSSMHLSFHRHPLQLIEIVVLL